MAKPLLVAQISDTHIKPPGRLAYGRVDTARCLARCVDHINGLRPRPDAVMITGDLVDFGAPEAYHEVRRLLEPLAMPAYLVPGNHDDREALRAAFRDHAYLQPGGEFLQYAVEHFPVRLIGLDTTVPGAPGGALCDRRLQWLADRLGEAPGRPTILFMHHPPFLTGIRHMDVQNCRDGPALAELLGSHPQVTHLFCGHVHRAIQVRWHGIAAGIAPSPCHAVTFDLREDGPPAFTLEPPALLLHYWREETSLITHVLFIGDFEGPYPFFDGQGALID